MRTKSLKSTRQIFMLKRYLENRTDKWPKQEVIKLAKQIKLSRAQVYKWLWDQRNVVRQMEKYQLPQKYPFTSFNHFAPRDERKEVPVPQKKICKKLRKVTLKRDCQLLEFQVPEMIEFAVKMRISTDTPVHTRMILKRYGFELTRIRNCDNLDSFGQRQRSARISEFNPVMEEKLPAKK